MESALKVKNNIAKFSSHVVQHNHDTRKEDGK
jgi:hypothetical protein